MPQPGLRELTPFLEIQLAGASSVFGEQILVGIHRALRRFTVQQPLWANEASVRLPVLDNCEPWFPIADRNDMCGVCEQEGVEAPAKQGSAKQPGAE